MKRRLKVNDMTMPGFTAGSLLGQTMSKYRGTAVFGGFPSKGGGGVMPQLRFLSDPDWARTGVQGKWRERSHMPFLWWAAPFTIGGLIDR